MGKLLQRFLGSVSGNTTILFALASVPILLATGAAVDYLRLNNTMTEIQSALDGAALAAALPSDMTDDQRAAIAKDYFKRNVAGGWENSDELVVAFNGRKVQVRFQSELETTFMGLAGLKAMEIDETAEVMKSGAGSAELALVLDYSLSMNKKNKYQDMAAAASDMLETLDDFMPDGKLKVGLVPFSAMVYTSMDKSYVTQASATQTWTGCTQDRAYPHNTNVDTPTVDVNTKWGAFDNDNNGDYGCNNYANKKLKIEPLTSDIQGLINRIDEMRPIGKTNIPLGAEFGWNLLDPQLPYDEGLPYDEPAHKKFLILLTDGVQTSPQNGQDGGRNVDNGNDNLLELCSNMRDANIVVFAIAYDITDPEVTDLLKDCAPGRYFEPAAGSNQISAVFDEITNQISNTIVRLSK